MIEAILRRFCRIAGKKLPSLRREKMQEYPDASLKFKVQSSRFNVPTPHLEL